MSSTPSSRRRTTPCFVCIESEGIVANFNARQQFCGPEFEIPDNTIPNTAMTPITMIDPDKYREGDLYPGPSSPPMGLHDAHGASDAGSHAHGGVGAAVVYTSCLKESAAQAVSLHFNDVALTENTVE
jgi:hypothetical protein